MELLVSTTPTENRAAWVDSDRLATATSPRHWRLNTLRAGYLFVVAGADRLDLAIRPVASDCLWMVIVVAAIPWRYLLAEHVVKRGERWRSR